jgi:hypothetical protein
MSFSFWDNYLSAPKKIALPYQSLKISNFLISLDSYLLFLNHHHHPLHDLTVLNIR